MLNQSRTLEYIKKHLGFPFQPLELRDEEIVEHFSTYTVRDWSQYFPDIKQISINLLLDINKVPGRQNEYLIEDPQGLEILTVKNIYFPLSDMYVFGHPPYGPFTYGDAADWALSTEMANTTKLFSSWDKTFEFKHPNIIRISPIPDNIKNCTVEYERMQHEDLSGIENTFQVMFMQLALADIMILLGRVRKRYESLTTPFGQIPLSGEIYEEGKELRREIIDKLIAGSYTNVIFDKG